MLCIALLSGSIPLLLAIGSLPQQTFFGEDIYLISQVTNDKAIPYELSLKLRNKTWIEAVSPEVYAFCVVKSEPVIVRGIESEAFMALDRGTVVSGSAGEDFLLAGTNLASRLDLSIGDKVILTGSTQPTIEEMEVTGKYESNGPPRDEILIPLRRSWGISPIGQGYVLAIRVRTEEYDALRTFLNETDIPLVLGDGTTSVVLNSEERFDARLATLLFQNPELGGQRGVAHTSVFVQQAGTSVQIVIWGFLVLNSSLVTLGLIAVLSKAIVEKRADVGILSAIGASRVQVARMLILELVLISIPAAIIGVLLGYVIATLLGLSDAVLLFGYTILPLYDPVLLLELALVTIVLEVVLGAIIYHLLSREKPVELIRGVPSRERKRTLEEVLSD
ncbi:MAG: ABC transporter permease [Thermoplasmata archaeon]